jgi:hypothetical protein
MFEPTKGTYLVSVREFLDHIYGDDFVSNEELESRTVMEILKEIVFVSRGIDTVTLREVLEWVTQDYDGGTPGEFWTGFNISNDVLDSLVMKVINEYDEIR